MDLNSMVFPKPPPSYKAEEYKFEMIWIPKRKEYSYNDILKYSQNKNKFNLESISTENPFKKKPIFEGENIENYLSNDNMGNLTKVNRIPSFAFKIQNKFFDNKLEKKEYVPCLYIKTDEANKKCDKIIIYFHANYEDIGNCHNLLATMAKYNRINVLAVEYPGYGAYDYGKKECSAEEIIKDADIVYYFLNSVMKINEENIIIMGRCIGSGPAVYLSINNNPKCLILMSPFTSIKDAVKSMFKKYNIGWFFEKLIKDRFNNLDDIGKIKCPVLFIHGKQDKIIPWEHSYKLMLKCISPAKLITPKNMDHNNYDIFKDVIYNLKDFFSIFLDDEKTDNLKFERFSFMNSMKSKGNFMINPFSIEFPQFMYDDPFKNSFYEAN